MTEWLSTKRNCICCLFPESATNLRIIQIHSCFCLFVLECANFYEYKPKLIWMLTFDYMLGFLWWFSGKESACQCRRPGFVPWVRKIPRRRKWQPIPVFLPGQYHGQRCLESYTSWDCKELVTTEWLSTSREEFIPFVPEQGLFYFHPYAVVIYFWISGFLQGSFHWTSYLEHALASISCSHTLWSCQKPNSRSPDFSRNC